MLHFKRSLLLVASALLLITGSALAQDDEGFSLTVLHTNDEHAHHDPNSAGDGGQARLATVVDMIRASDPNVLLVDGGDRFTGTLYHQQFRGQDNAQLMNLIGYDVMSLGNHEFDDGSETLAAFINALNFPVVSANITTPEGDPLSSLLAPYVILDVNGTQIGVIGLTTSEVPELSSPPEGMLFDGDYAGVVNAITAELAGQGVNKILLLTHIGYDADIALAPSLAGVDAIIGGHTNTLLSNVYNAAGENTYPAELTSAAGEPIVVVQAGGGDGLYLGDLNLSFDGAGILSDWGGDVILLSRFIAPRPDVEALLAEFAAPIEALRETPVGDTQVFLVGDRSVCRAAECNLGNLITDALRWHSGAQIAITNGGGIRSNIPVTSEIPADLVFAEPYTVTLGDVLTVLPFGNLVATLELNGADIVTALENGLSQIESGAGRFPQVSGLHYTYDPAAEPGSRIVSVEVESEDGSYAPLDEAAVYSIATNDFMRRGGDGYTVLAENAINPYDFGTPMDQVVADYIVAFAPINPQVEGRITAAGQ
ncbi:MAG: 5'-nucleotidase C-terminal domain-containing protein [Anaerolineae bacterium]|nr:5'-nucleotidase C-terminal domain-containing protein [Anaerolineae bacterium]